MALNALVRSTKQLLWQDIIFLKLTYMVLTQLHLQVHLERERIKNSL